MAQSASPGTPDFRNFQTSIGTSEELLAIPSQLQKDNSWGTDNDDYRQLQPARRPSNLWEAPTHRSEYLYRVPIPGDQFGSSSPERPER